MTEQKRLTASQVGSRTGLTGKTIRRRYRKAIGGGRLDLIKGHYHLTFPVSKVIEFQARRKRNAR